MKGLDKDRFLLWLLFYFIFFFLACEDLGERPTNYSPPSVFFFFFFQGGDHQFDSIGQDSTLRL